MALTLDLGTDLKKSREMGPDSTDDLGDCKQNKKNKNYMLENKTNKTKLTCETKVKTTMK